MNSKIYYQYIQFIPRIFSSTKTTKKQKHFNRSPLRHNKNANAQRTGNGVRYQAEAASHDNYEHEHSLKCWMENKKTAAVNTTHSARCTVNPPEGL